MSHPRHRAPGSAPHFLTWALGQSPDQTQLWTFQANARARTSYERAGFSAVELTDGQRNEELEPDVRYVRTRPTPNGRSV